MSFMGLKPFEVNAFLLLKNSWVENARKFNGYHLEKSPKLFPAWLRSWGDADLSVCQGLSVSVSVSLSTLYPFL